MSVSIYCECLNVYLILGCPKILMLAPFDLGNN